LPSGILTRTTIYTVNAQTNDLTFMASVRTEDSDLIVKDIARTSAEDSILATTPVSITG